MSNKMGKIRPSQLIYHFGPGAIADMLEQSVMIMAADLWDTRSLQPEEDERITRALNVDHIKLLNERPDAVKVKAREFPSWKICPKCNMMTDFKNKYCYFCKQEGEEIELYPSRFVVACKNGHIQDFPYIDWVHQNRACTSSQPVLKLIRRGSSGSLSDLSIQCVKCKEKKSLGLIMQKGALHNVMKKCSGKRPWMNDHENCGELMETYLRGASNIYSPAVVSFLQIPITEKQTEPLYETVKESKIPLQKAREKGEVYFDVILDALDFHPTQKDSIKKILDGEHEEEVTYESIRKQEWNTLVQGKINDQTNTGYISKQVDIHKDMKKYFSAIHKIESLPEIQILRGFTRIKYLDRFEISEDKDLLPIMKHENTNWLPGVRNNGEGVFFQFDEHQLRDWEMNYKIKSITDGIIKRYNKQRDQLGYSALSFKGKHILLHTFSHAMIKELAAYSGYATTALKERIYCAGDMQGVLIYTASGDSEGSLGGLIEQANPDRLYPIFIRAMERMMYCSSDPHCSEGEFKYHTTANGAACNACSFVSETSCEWGNQLLDRRLLLNINPGEGFGYFEV